jgi:hypothetical protein
MLCNKESVGSICRSQHPELIRCSEVVEVELPACGHVLQVPCCQAAEFRSNPELCTATVEVLPCAYEYLAMFMHTVCTRA